MGKFHPSLRIVYCLFTKIDLANKNAPFGAFHKMVMGWTLDAHPIILLILVYASSSPNGRRKDSAISCTPSRKP